MLSSLALLGFAAIVAASPAPQATASGYQVTPYLTASGPAPSGCVSSYPGPFALSPSNVTSSKHSKRQSASSPTILIESLEDGVMKDSKNTFAYIASNGQFQNNPPSSPQPQPGAIITAGYSVCSNGTLALGGSAIWWECNGGSRSAFYDVSQGPQCYMIYFNVVPASTSSGTTAIIPTTTVSVATVSSEGQGQGGTTVTPVTESSEGQGGAGSSATVAASTVTPITVSSEGQGEAGTSATVAATTVTPVTVAPEGQPGAGNSTVVAPTATSSSLPIATNGAAVFSIGAEFAAMVAGVAAIAML